MSIEIKIDREDVKKAVQMAVYQNKALITADSLGIDLYGYSPDILGIVADIIGVPKDNTVFLEDGELYENDGCFPDDIYCRDWIVNALDAVTSDEHPIDKLVDDLIESAQEDHPVWRSE